MSNLIRISFSQEERKAISSALLILLASDEHLTRSKASHDNAFEAGEKLDFDKELFFSRGEARAITASVDIALELIPGAPESLAPVEAEFEGAIEDIVKFKPVLEQLAPRLHAVFSKRPRK